ncbi:hypothetical protein DL768_009951 [Monosporascus sp. mg162]|nr:hypothetical protein DL768_009951 [Monosporascus sp. mg162]
MNTQISREFRVCRTAGSLTITMYLFGTGSGALFAGRSQPDVSCLDVLLHALHHGVRLDPEIRGADRLSPFHRICFAVIAAGATFFNLGALGLYSWARGKAEHVRGGSVAPEFRLWPAITLAPLLPASLFWLGWSNQPGVSIWSNLGACFVFDAVISAIYVSSYEYIINSYGEHAASSPASITMVRYLVAGAMARAARPTYGGVGVH